MVDSGSYKQIFKSTGIIGISQVLNIIISVFRTKILAVLLGPEGIGIQGMFQSSIDLIRSVTSLGINFSGIKDIAEASESKEQERIYKVIIVLRRLALITGFLGFIIMLLFCIPLSNYSFGNSTYSLDIAILSFVIIFSSISAVQLTLLQGFRKIFQMALVTLLGSLLGTCVTIPLYWQLGRVGIVPGFILMALASLFVSWFYVRKIKVPFLYISLKETLVTGYGMMKTGLFFVISGFGSTLTMYAIRSLIMKKIGSDGNEDLGLAAVGGFQAVWTITRVYMGLLTNAMLADYFPRLSAINNDVKASNKLVNEQLEMTLLLGVPLIVGMLVFAPLVVQILYSNSFIQALPLLEWQIPATFFTIVSWPLSVMFIAKGKSEFSMLIDLSWCLIFYLFVCLGWNCWGFNTLGIVYLLAGFIHCILIVCGVIYLSDFKFAKFNMRLIFYSCILLVVTFCIVLFSDNCRRYLIGILCFIFSLFISFRRLKLRLEINKFFKKKF